jgi:hypothetical protein
MIIQRVIKGIRGISKTKAQAILDAGIECNLCRIKGQIAYAEIPKVLTEHNAEWHQDHYEDDDPLWNNPKNEKFYLHTPFVSTTAGTWERKSGQNVPRKAFDIALRFATDGLTVGGYLFYCDLFILGRPAVEIQAFSEELRELNVHPRHTVHQVEGEILAKLVIPPAQIERADAFDVQHVKDALSNGRQPAPDPNGSLTNSLYVDPSRYSNVRGVVT